MFSPVIVVVAYNRPKALNRILTSLNNAIYSNDSITLIISIDRNNEDLNNKKVHDIANAFNWKYGNKEIIFHKEHLGLKKHIIKCGNLLNKFDSLIMLEDDIFVSPYFYMYTLKALSFYGNSSYLGGIALYNYSFNETAGLPFMPIDDGSDSYFLQLPCSWGQVWTKNQWKLFSEWNVQQVEVIKDITVPGNITAWPESSWKKYFAKYLIDTHKYFVYPRQSLTTNFSDDGGTHMNKSTLIFQVPILNHEKEFNFLHLNDALAVYDIYCELLPEKLICIAKSLVSYDFECDLYGTKEIDAFQSDYILTTQNYAKKVEKSYGLKMRPLEMNLVYNIEGNQIFLIRRKDIVFRSKIFTLLYDYFHPKIDKRTLVMVIKKIIRKLSLNKMLG